MDDWLLEIAVPGFEPVERRIDRALLSIGSDRGADVRITSLSERWAIVRRVDAGLELRRIGVAGARVVPIGGALEVDGVELRLRDASAPEVVDDGLPLEALAEALAEADQPADALAALVEGLIAATRAQTGAIVLRDETGYRIPIARRADGRPLEGAEALLSDTVVSDVLDGAEKSVCVSDLGQSERYATVPSVVSLSLSSVLCVPMRMGARVLGAVYLGHHDPRHRFSDTHARDLGLLATMALPLLEQLRRRALEPAAATERLVGESEPMVRVRELVRRVAPSDLSVLVLGETGTGKEVAARAIHEASPRAELPMIALNCAAVPESLLAVELFGCKKGAYTGAVSDRKGRIEAADGSTLFLDEVGDMPLSMQVALLRVLEEKAVTRVGENEERPVDFRLVAATSVDLDAAVEAGRFRKDLLYRLRELAVHLPPLRDRGEDLLLLASLFLQQCARSLGIGGHELSAASRRAILAHRWEGNVRELRAVMRRASILCDGRTIEPEHLQLDSKAAVEGESLGPLDLPLVEARDRFVTRYVATVLDRHDGNREAAAAALDISVRSLYRYLA
ncbi:MAG: sigma 54-interacting transcriptional regulator [Sandaracinaceae bacterium]|nr:sigma 54-interacting transcriptional regulator [Sandaracinaceae bacterium]